MKHKNQFDYITICNDPDIMGNDNIKKIGSKEIDHFSVEEFLSMPGNPVVEKDEYLNKLSKMDIREAYRNGHGHVSRIILEYLYSIMNLEEANRKYNSLMCEAYNKDYSSFGGIDD